MTDFVSVVPALGQALSKRGYAVLTPVQEAVLAPGLRDADILVSAQTGSGKTVAFGLALAPTLLNGAERFAHAAAPLALAVAPTRELALQVRRELEWLYEMTGASVASCVGGMDMRDERRALERGAHIVVGTPGRLRDHIERGSLDMTGLRAVVLDEADEMLDLGFRDDLEYILDAAPAERRTLMFSATVPRSIATLAKRYQRDAARISTTAERKQHVDIEYRALTVAPNDRENAIINVLRYFEAKNALVFCATRATVSHMTSRFANRGFSVVALSGELSQNERSHALQAMRDGRARVCIATDVAARGIDLPNLELVIHADLPTNRETLLHRSGRTGRAGRKGVCVLIVPHNARRRAEQLLRDANVEAAWARPPTIDDIVQRDRERMLDDPSLSEPASEDERSFARDLVTRHGAEQVAAAFVRLYRAGRSAPEELLDTAPPERSERRERQRDGFTNGVWFSLSVGRKQNAEPRWLVPMLCRAGHITKRDIGAIRIRPDETHVELAPDCVARFLDAVGPGRTVEKTISVAPLEGAAPKVAAEPRSEIPDGAYAKQTPSAPRKPDARGRSEPRRPVARKDRAPAEDRKRRDMTEAKPDGRKPYKTGVAGKSSVKSLAAGTKDRAPEMPGFGARKRKKQRHNTV
jgi:ATP-dependent RNA helicase DeaD